MAEYAGKTVVFKTEAEVNEAIRLYEEETVTHFVTSTVMKSFTKTEMKVNRFRWYVNARNEEGVTIPYDGIPFCFVGKKAMTCHMGEDRGRATKKKYHEQKAKAEAEGSRKYRKRAPVASKKSQCSAKVSIKKIVKFPDYQLEEGKEQNYDQRQNNKRLLAALNQDSEAVMKQIQYYVKFPAIEDHKDHPMGEEAAKKEPIDKRVHEKMKQLADAGVSSYSALQKLVYSYVEKELFKDKPLPPRTRRRYFPSVKDVQNFMTKHKSASLPSGRETTAAESHIPLIPDWQGDADHDEDDDHHDNTAQEQIVNVAFQAQQVATRAEQESFLTLLNAGMAGPIQQEVVATTSTIAPPHTIASTPQMMHAPTDSMHGPTESMHGPTESIQGTTECHQVASTSMMPDGTQIMAPHSSSHQIVFTSQELLPVNSTEVVTQENIQEIIPEELVSVKQLHPKKPQRIGLVCRMKALSRELLDYSLLVKDLTLLEGFVEELESMVTKASSNATLDPITVQRELARNRKKRQAGPPVFSNDASKKFRLSDILLSQPARTQEENSI